MKQGKLTNKQLKAIKGYIETGTLLGAASYVGEYKNDNSARASVHRLLNVPQVELVLTEELNKLGFDAVEIAKKLKDMTRAEKTVIISHKGKVLIFSFPDFWKPAI